MEQTRSLLPEPQRLLTLAVGIILVCIFASGLVYLAWGIDLLKKAPRFSFCPFHLLTGMPCPGCGMARALISIGQLRFQQALHYNPFAFPLVLAMVSFLLPWNPFDKLINPRWYQLGLVAVLIFWVLRLAVPGLSPV